MIKDLISKPMEESTVETEHKGWYDTELTTKKELTSTLADLAQDLEAFAVATKELDAAMAEATATRTESKEKNEEAITNAMAILKDLYAKSAQATAPVQKTPAEDAPETVDKPGQGMLPENGNVVDSLEVILTNAACLESETPTCAGRG